MSYRAPVDHIETVLSHVLPYAAIGETEKFSEATTDMTAAILGEAAKMAEDILAPLNREGDIQGAVLENGVVRATPGYHDGFKAIAEGGWIGINADPAHGGMGLPITLMSAVGEMMSSACLSLSLNPLMTQGQIEALEAHASDEIKDIYLPKLISGEWCGTMNLTEPQAGSDVGALRSKAEPQPDGSYKISGQKIYISWGDHDLTDNICHLVLARLPDGVPGTKGISLFMVPKRIPNPDGTLGAHNTVRPISLEEKLGLHGSPTAVMEFDAATGWIIGEPHSGMAAMFTMMNNARLGVGIQGLGVAEAAYQHALAYALDRKQGKTPGGDGAIFDHADVRRMLMKMKALTTTARAICLDCAVSLDMAAATGDAAWKSRAAFLTPIAKSFGTDAGSEVADMGVQVHGGMGYIEETGAAQFLRDVRVTRIYEGTNGIQAMDLTGRKLMDGGEAARGVLDDIKTGISGYSGVGKEALAQALFSVSEATETLLEQDNLHDRFAGATSYLRAFALLLGAHYLIKEAGSGSAGATGMLPFYMSHILPEINGLCITAVAGMDPVFGLNADLMAS